MNLFKIIIPLLLSLPACGATTSGYSTTTGTVSVMSNFRQVSSEASSYASLLRSYESASYGYICLRCLDVYMSIMISNIYQIPRYLDSYTIDDTNKLIPEFYSMTQEIGYVLNALIDASDNFDGGPYSDIVRAQVGLLGLVYSAGVSSLWESIATNLPCSSALRVSTRLRNFGSNMFSAASAYSADSVSYVPDSETCFSTSFSTTRANATASVPTAGLYAGVSAAASEARKNTTESTTSSLQMESSTRSGLRALATAVRSAKNAALAHPRLVGSQENLQGFKEASQGIFEVLLLIYQNPASYKQYEYEYRTLTLELAAMLYAQLEKANSLPCSDYRSVASQFISLTSARYAVYTKVFSYDMAAFPTIRPPYTQTCLYNSFASPTVGQPEPIPQLKTRQMVQRTVD